MSSGSLLDGDIEHSGIGPDLRLIHITDTHLTGAPNGELLGMNTERSARAVIHAAKEAATAADPIDAILITGDIAADEQPGAYRQLDEMLGSDIPSLWLPGNHDCISPIADSLTHHLKRRLRSEFWDVLMLETQVQGEVGGYLTDTELDALSLAISDAASDGKALLIATHHPLRSLNSAWLDEQAVRNAADAVDLLKHCAAQTTFISGHVHQASDARVSGIRMLTTPSTCVQFAPGSQDFALDNRSPGYRSLLLRQNKSIETQVVRISDDDNRPLVGSSGYH